MPMPDRPYVDNHEERVRRRREEDVPTIGDYSHEWDERVGLARPKAKARSRQTEQTRLATRAREESWRLDPQEVRRRNAELARHRRRPLSFVAVLLVIAGAVVAFLTYEPLRTIGATWLATARSVLDRNGSGASPPPGESAASDAPAPAAVAPQEPPLQAPAPTAPVVQVPATSQPNDVAAPPANATVNAPVEPVKEPAAAHAVDEPVAEAPTAPPTAPPAPAEPPAPERFEFATSVVSVSESAPGARAQIRRSGGTLA